QGLLYRDARQARVRLVRHLSADRKLGMPAVAGAVVHPQLRPEDRRQEEEHDAGEQIQPERLDVTLLVAEAELVAEEAGPEQERHDAVEELGVEAEVGGGEVV